MSWFNSFTRWGRTPPAWKKFAEFRDEYPNAMRWLKDNTPHKVSIRKFKDKKGRWRVQIVDESPVRMGNRNKLGVTPGSGYGDETEADIVACVLWEMDEERVAPRIFTDRNGRYRWRLVNLLTDGTEDIIQNTSGASFSDERECRRSLARVLFAERMEYQG